MAHREGFICGCTPLDLTVYCSCVQAQLLIVLFEWKLCEHPHSRHIGRFPYEKYVRWDLRVFLCSRMNNVTIERWDVRASRFFSPCALFFYGLRTREPRIRSRRKAFSVIRWNSWKIEPFANAELLVLRWEHRTSTKKNDKKTCTSKHYVASGKTVYWVILPRID